MLDGCERDTRPSAIRSSSCDNTEIFLCHKYVLGHEVSQVDTAQEAVNYLAPRSRSRQSRKPRGGPAVHLVAGPASQLRDLPVTENGGQFHPSCRP